MARKVIITVAPCGAETTRKNNPALPLTPAEIADSTYEAYQAGASVCHLHVRDENGQATQDIEVFRQAIDLIRAKCDIVIETSTGGAVGMTAEERLQPVRLNPEMASLDCGTINFGNDYIVNDLPLMREFAQAMLDRQVRPILECFDISQIYTSKTLIKEGLLKPPFYYGLVLNVPGAMPYTPHWLTTMVNTLPEQSLWCAVGIGGRASLPCCLMALAAEGHMRVGFEDNVYYAKGRLAQSNAELVERCARLVKAADFEIARPDDVREMLDLRRN